MTETSPSLLPYWKDPLNSFFNAQFNVLPRLAVDDFILGVEMST